ncbi:MAG TPA: hypothetical protein VIX91_10735 [Candidatus Acidoferrum sp.]
MANFLNGSYIIAEAEQTVQGQERSATGFAQILHAPGRLVRPGEERFHRTNA